MNFMSFLRAQILTVREPVTTAINTTNCIAKIRTLNHTQLMLLFTRLLLFVNHLHMFQNFGTRSRHQHIRTSPGLIFLP